MSDFPPDSKLVRTISPSPNQDERRAAIDMILLHYTGMESPDAALSRLCSAEARVSSHYFVDEAGGIVQLVPEVRRAWHAGISSWFGVTDINSCSIGIEIVNPGHDFGYPDFSRRPDQSRDGPVAGHRRTPQNSCGAGAGAFGCRARPQERSRREISVGEACGCGRGPMGRSDRSRSQVRNSIRAIKAVRSP